MPPKLGCRLYLLLYPSQPMERYLSNSSHFLPFTKLSLGSGNLIRFWLDLWADSIPLQSRFPRLFNISTTLKEDLISSFISTDNGWDLHFCRNLRDSEINRLVNLLAVLHSSQVTSSQLDSRLWSPSLSANFSVSSFYSAISAHSPSPPFPHRTIWFSLSPSKVQAFLWKVAWNQGLALVSSNGSSLTMPCPKSLALVPLCS